MARVEGESLLLLQEAVEYLLKKDVNNAVENIKKATELIEKMPIYQVNLIDLAKYNISNNNINGKETTEGINKLIVDLKEKGYKRIKLPEGIYSIDTSVKNPIALSDGANEWTHNREGIVMQSNMELILDDATLQMIPCEDPYYSIVTISNCKNSKITGGTILGDRETHDYGMRINENGDMFESGDFDSTTGEPKVDDSKVRTKDFISVYKDWFTGNEEPLPTKFYIIPLWNTTMNTVDGGCRYIYCYDEDGEYLGLTTGGSGYISQATLLPNTSKIKLSIRGEKRLDIVLSMTKRNLYYTYEFGSGITITSSSDIEINGTTVKNCIGDCILTMAPPLKVTVDNLNILNCTLENSRRQGISFTATGENYLVQGCNIGKINGVDPQCGIDFEHYDYVRNVVIDNCNFYDNKKWDIINYNGTEIEVRDCNFTGAIATTFGHDMDIHNNMFEYKDTPNNDKVFKCNSLNLGTINNTVYENQFIGGGTTNTGENSKSYNNIFKDAKSTISSQGENKYYNCEVGIRQNDSLSDIENNYFENCKVFNHNDSPSLKVNNCIFENSSYNARGKTNINNCKFNLKDKALLGGWKTDTTIIEFNNCEITAEKDFLENGLNTKLIFNNCKLIIPSKRILQYGHITFNDCDIKFTECDNNINFIWAGYGSNSPFEFNNCHFKSDVKITIEHTTNCTSEGNVILK